MRTSTHIGVLVLIPAKPLAVAKRRLGLPPAHRRLLASAFLADTLAAATRAKLVGEVVVLTPDPDLGRIAEAHGAHWLPDRSTAGLNQAIEDGLAQLPGHCGKVAVLVADLPAARPDELDDALDQLHDGAQDRICVVDHAGAGTTLLAATAADLLRPQFGASSARRHIAAGFRRAVGELSGLRHDVDTLEDLRRVAELPALGQATAAALRRLQPIPPGAPSPPGAPRP